MPPPAKYLLTQELYNGGHQTENYNNYVLRQIQVRLVGSPNLNVGLSVDALRSTDIGMEQG